MFRIGELDDNTHSISSSSVGLFNSNCDVMSVNQGNNEPDFMQETSVFGNFDPDDPDFCVTFNVNNSSNIISWSANRVSNPANTLLSRPCSRQSFGRNNSSNSLKRTKSTNSMGGSRFYIGMSKYRMNNAISGKYLY